MSRPRLPQRARRHAGARAARRPRWWCATDGSPRSATTGVGQRRPGRCAADRPGRADARSRLHRRPRPHLEDRPPADDDARPARRRQRRGDRRQGRRVPGPPSGRRAGSSAAASTRRRWPRAGPRPAHDLDRAAPDQPVVLTRTCGHIYAVQLGGARPRRHHRPTPPRRSAARSAATPTGAPTGLLHETAMGLVTRVMPPPSADDYERMIVAALRHQRTLGITSSSDCGVAPAAARRLSGGGRRRPAAGPRQRHAAAARRRRAGAGAAAGDAPLGLPRRWTR